jgi:hypothetical protein
MNSFITMLNSHCHRHLLLLAVVAGQMTAETLIWQQSNIKTLPCSMGILFNTNVDTVMMQVVLVLLTAGLIMVDLLKRL